MTKFHPCFVSAFIAFCKSPDSSLKKTSTTLNSLIGLGYLFFVASDTPDPSCSFITGKGFALAITFLKCPISGKSRVTQRLQRTGGRSLV